MTKPSKRDYLITHEIEEEVLLYDPTVDLSHRLNVTATFIWQHCDGEHTPEQIAQLLTDNFEVDYDCALADTHAVLEEMAVEKKLIAGAA